MGTSNVSGIDKLFTQGQTMETGIAASEENITVNFSKLMNQMTSGLQGSVLSGDNSGKSGQTEFAVQPASSKQDYARITNRREVEVADAPDTKWRVDDTAKEKIDAFSDDVKEVLKEELGVTDEQIEEAMETLGLSYADLVQPGQLASLVAELTGESDMSALLVSDEFMNVMQEVSTLSESLLQELGVSREDFLAQLEEMKTVSDAMTDIPADTEVSADTALDTSELTQTDVTEETVTDTSEPTVVVERAETQGTDNVQENVKTAGTEEHTEQTTEAEVSEETTEQVETVTTEETADSSQDDAKEESTGNNNNQNVQTKSVQTQTTNTANGVTVQNVTTQTTVTGTEGTTGFSSQLDVQNIIRQIVEFSKVTVGNTATTMEMQLNPENLGKIMMSVTSKDGTVSAQIFTQNEAVKEALEQQIVTLKENMNQAGVKVDAVEVSVGSHEFERNLEQEAKQDERQAEEQEKASGSTRRINLNELDELSGVMSEEESLVAQMMAEQGNSIDYTA